MSVPSNTHPIPNPIRPAPTAQPPRAVTLPRTIVDNERTWAWVNDPAAGVVGESAPVCESGFRIQQRDAYSAKSARRSYGPVSERVAYVYEWRSIIRPSATRPAMMKLTDAARSLVDTVPEICSGIPADMTTRSEPSAEAEIFVQWWAHGRFGYSPDPTPVRRGPILVGRPVNLPDPSAMVLEDRHIDDHNYVAQISVEFSEFPGYWYFYARSPVAHYDEDDTNDVYHFQGPDKLPGKPNDAGWKW